MKAKKEKQGNQFEPGFMFYDFLTWEFFLTLYLFKIIAKVEKCYYNNRRLPQLGHEVESLLPHIEARLTCELRA